MPFPQELVARLRAKLDSGALPLETPEKMYAGHGRGETCAGCGEAIKVTDVVYEMDYGADRTYALHLACAGLWERERARRQSAA